MKFLIDQGLSPSLAAWLVARGHDAAHVRDRDLSRADDIAILECAVREARILISVDLDFPRLLALRGAHSPGLIVFRPGNFSDTATIDLIERVLANVEPAELERSVTVITESAIRVVALPLRPR